LVNGPGIYRGFFFAKIPAQKPSATHKLLAAESVEIQVPGGKILPLQKYFQEE